MRGVRLSRLDKAKLKQSDPHTTKFKPESITRQCPSLVSLLGFPRMNIKCSSTKRHFDCAASTNNTGGRHPLLAHCGRRSLIVDTLNNVANPAWRRPPFISVCLVVCYSGIFVQCLLKDCDTSALHIGGVPSLLRSR